MSSRSLHPSGRVRWAWWAAGLLIWAGPAAASGSRPATVVPTFAPTVVSRPTPTPAGPPVVTPAPAQAATGSAAAELARAQKEIANLTAEFTLFISGSGPKGRDLEAHGRVWLGPGRRYRVEYDRPEEQVLVSDGTRRWLYLKKIAQVQVQPLPPPGSASELFLELGGGLPSLLERCRVEWLADAGDQRTYVLTPRPNSGLDFSRARLRVAGPRLLPQRVEVEAARRIEVEFTGLVAHTHEEAARTPGATVPAERFRFTPPPGAEVIEPLVTAP